MALSFARGTIRWLAADAATTTYTVSGLSFQPKALMFVTMGAGAATDIASTGDWQSNIGFALSTSDRRCIHTFSDNANTTVRAQMAYRNAEIAAQSAHGDTNTTGELDLNSITSDGFTLIVDDQGLQDLVVEWYAWGGSDLTAYEIFELTEPAATGDTATNLTGAFQPDALIFAGSNVAAGPPTFLATADGTMMLGFASSSASTDQVVIVTNDDDAGGTSDTDGYIREGEVIALILNGGGNPNTLASLTSFDADGFTLNYAATANTGRRIIGLALQGGQWKAGGYTIDGSTGSATATVSGLAFQPIGGLGFTKGTTQSAAGTSTAEAKISIGGWAGTSDRSALGAWNESAMLITEIDHIVEYDAFLALPSAAGAAASAFDLSAITSDGFTVIVDTAGGVASEYHGYLVFASDAGGGATSYPFQPRRITPLLLH